MEKIGIYKVSATTDITAEAKVHTSMKQSKGVILCHINKAWLSVQNDRLCLD